MQRLLDQPIHHRRDAQCPRTPPCGLGMSTRRTGWGMYSPASSLSLDRRPVLLEVILEFGHSDAIDPGRAFVLDHPLIGELQVATFAHGVHQPAFLFPLRFRPQTGRHVSLGAQAGPAGGSAPVPPPGYSLAASLLPSSTVRVVPPPTCGFQCSALRFVLTPTMASADFCMSLPTPLDAGSTEVPLGTLADLPGYDAPTFTLMSVGYTSRRSVQVSGFADIGLLTPPCRLLSASCSSDQRFAFGFLQISQSPTNTLAVRLTLPLVGRVEDSHLQVSAPCRAHRQKNPAGFPAGPAAPQGHFPRARSTRKKPQFSRITSRPSPPARRTPRSGRSSCSGRRRRPWR